jgi:hypothetical protein
MEMVLGELQNPASCENGRVFQLLLKSVKKRRNWTLINYYVVWLHALNGEE